MRTSWNQLSCQRNRGKTSFSLPFERMVGWTALKSGHLSLPRRWWPCYCEFHHVFSLEPNEIRCTDATEHVIELMKDEPFKERFRRITPPLVNGVCQHIQEMLDGGAIRPSQSPWCNAVVLVRKKDGVAPVLHQLLPLERPNQEGCLSPALYAGDHGEHGGHLTLFLYGLEEWVLAGQNG